MAQRITSGKREREKQKQQKRQQKQLRKEQRLSNGPRSFEEMLAYADDNGNLHATPQDAEHESINLEDIPVSVPKQEAVEVEPLRGRVDYFNQSKGYGFIRDLASDEKYFFHISVAPEGIAEQDQVTFEIERGTKGMTAVRISIINHQ